MAEPTVTVAKSTLDMLLDRDRILSALEAGGVSDWEWYEASLENIEED